VQWIVDWARVRCHAEPGLGDRSIPIGVASRALCMRITRLRRSTFITTQAFNWARTFRRLTSWFGHRRLNRLLLVIDAGQFIVVRDDREIASHTVIVETTTREFPCMYVCSVARRRPPEPVTYISNSGRLRVYQRCPPQTRIVVTNSSGDREHGGRSPRSLTLRTISGILVLSRTSNV
jgi:hypothetical protein